MSKSIGSLAGAMILLPLLSQHTSAQTVTMDAFVQFKGKSIPTICLISKAPPPDICGEILQGLTVPEIQILQQPLDLQLQQQYKQIQQQDKPIK